MTCQKDIKRRLDIAKKALERIESRDSTIEPTPYGEVVRPVFVGDCARIARAALAAITEN